MRIPDNLRFQRQGDAITQAKVRLDQAQRRVATGQRIERAHEDLYGASALARMRSDLRAAQAYSTNASQAQGVLDTTDVALGRIQGLLHRAAELGLNGANGSHDTVSREALALEVDAVIGAVTTSANARIGERYVFAGTQALVTPFAVQGSPPTAVTYSGDAATSPIAVERGITVDVHVPGSALEAAGGGLFDGLLALRDALRNADGLTADAQAAQIRDRVAAVQQADDDVGALRTVVGGRQRRLTEVVERLAQATGDLEARYAQIAEQDLAQGAADVARSELSVQAALSMAARTFKNNLIDLIG